MDVKTEAHHKMCLCFSLLFYFIRRSQAGLEGSIVKYLIWGISLVNVVFAVNGLLNAFNILQTSKYSQTATACFAVIFLCMGVGGFYWSIFKINTKLALAISIGPWILALIVLGITMMVSDYK